MVLRRHRWAAVPVAVGYKFLDDEGVYLAAVLSYYGFVSMFPLLLIGVTVLGFVLHDDPAAQQAVLLAWIYIAASVFVVSTEIDAVLVQRLYPRSLFSMYPDDRATTPADRRAHASYARTERQKDYQTVDIRFDQPDPPYGQAKDGGLED